VLSKNQRILLLLILVCGVFLSNKASVSSETPRQGAASRLPCDLLQLQSRRFVLNLGRVNSPFIPNQGQFDEAVRFASIGLAGNNVYVDKNGVIRFSLGAVYGKPTALAEMIYVNANPRVEIVAGEPLESTTRYLSDTNSGGAPSNLKNFGRVITQDIYKGISASYTTTSRQFITEYLIQPATDLSQIRLRIPAAQNLKIDDATGNLLVVLPPGRTIKIHPAVLNEGNGVRYIRYRVEGKNTVSLNLANLVVKTKKPFVLKSRITLSPDFHEYDAVQDKNGFVFAASTAFNTLERGPTKSGRDVILARLDARGERILSTTIIAGNADDEASGIAVSLKGGVYVVGSTASKDFPIKSSAGTLPGKVKAFVAKLDETFSKLVSGNYVGGNSEAHDVTITEQGNVLVTGTTERAFANVNSTDFTFKTVFPVDDAAQNQPYFLAELEPDLRTTNHSFGFTATRLGSPISVTIDCHGDISVGVVHLQLTCGANASLQSTQMTYWTNSISNWNFPDVTNSTKTWGRHPISWKSYKAATTHNFYSYNIPSFPTGGIHDADGPILDQIEASGAFTLISGGAVSDPDGVWNVNRYDNSGWSPLNSEKVMELALGASFYHICCGSPVYAGYLEIPSCSNCMAIYDPMVIRQVNLCISNSGLGSSQTLQQALGPAWFSNPGGGDFHDVISPPPGVTISFDSFSGGLWRESGFSVFNNRQISSQWELSDLGWYIADPPESQRFIAENIEEAAGRLRNSMYAVTQLKETTYRKGRLAGAKQYAGRIRARDFPFHPNTKTRERF
jgi:hypothetical protein